MTEDDGKALWRQWKAAQDAPPAPVDPLELAAWAERPEEAAIEQRLALDPEALDSALAARAVALRAEPPAPLGLVRRARALVTPASPPPRRRVMDRVAVAAAMLLVAVLGFELGQELGPKDDLLAYYDEDAGAELP